MVTEALGGAAFVSVPHTRHVLSGSICAGTLDLGRTVSNADRFWESSPSCRGMDW